MCSAKSSTAKSPAGVQDTQGAPSSTQTPFPNKDMKLENHKPFSSKARQKIEEMVEKDFLEGVIKT